jgi:hypothetical protein
MRFYEIVVSSLLIVCLSAEVSAQELASGVSHQISAASKVRVQLVGGQWGTLHQPGLDTAGLSYTGSRFLNRGGGYVQLATPLPLAQVTQIQVPNGSLAGRGARIGGALGLGLSLLAIAATSGDSWVSPTTGQAVGAAIAWTATGAGVGAIIGSASRRWTTVYKTAAP